MKTSIIWLKIASGLAFISAILALSPTAKASSDKYHCRQVNNTYGIYSRVIRGDMKIMDFTRDVPQDWTIESRCQEVANRFQRYYDNETLRYIGSGYVNNEPVLCAVVSQNDDCSSDNILVTLPPKKVPHEEARKLMDTQGLASGVVIEVKGKGKLESYVNGNTYYDLEVLEQIILEQEKSDRLIESNF
ncbi:COP23 domain-containing protein [Waterburya agarophytonicola K14]|uniref:COP23 domain-containing protein n=1 Tax=Waterburya agarophytonicola KI4 TaxID=2874699 RepID=A0A964BTS9_9CYAN|nr:COP23 domain-containing protein [Waterburya agarophytonicola]MCC0178731.1 COP23 domain-containing protein [Waterburya agarophytonicola KI4]